VSVRGSLRSSWAPVWVLILASALSAHSLETAVPQRGERDIYTALLRDLFRGTLPTAFVIQTNPLALASPSPSDWALLGPGTAALRTRVETMTLQSTAAFTVESFPDGTTLVSKEDIGAFFRDASVGANLNDRWSAFHGRFKVAGYQGFSRPIVSDAGLDALVWYSNSYGSLGGEAGYAWLHRPSRSGNWVVEKRLPKVVS
jgi:hypothetical protein